MGRQQAPTQVCRLQAQGKPLIFDLLAAELSLPQQPEALQHGWVALAPPEEEVAVGAEAACYTFAS